MCMHTPLPPITSNSCLQPLTMILKSSFKQTAFWNCFLFLSRDSWWSWGAFPMLEGTKYIFTDFGDFKSKSCYCNKEIPNSFLCRILLSKHAGCCKTFDKHKKHEPCHNSRQVFVYFWKWSIVSCTVNYFVFVL